MKNLMKKSKKGFTLMEMLIVVAIIAILVVIAIPTFTNALNESRANTDLANCRAWYAEMVIEGMLDADGDIAVTEGEQSTCPWTAGYQSDDTVVTVTGTNIDGFSVKFENPHINDGAVTFSN